MGLKAGPTSSAGGGGGGQSNTILALGGGVALTATVTKVGVQLQVRSIAATSPLNVAQAADLITITIDALVNADIAAAAGILVNKLEALTIDENVITDGSGFLTTQAPRKSYFSIGIIDTPAGSEFYNLQVSQTGSTTENLRSSRTPIPTIYSNLLIDITTNTHSSGTGSWTLNDDTVGSAVTVSVPFGVTGILTDNSNTHTAAVESDMSYAYALGSLSGGSLSVGTRAIAYRDNT